MADSLNPGERGFPTSRLGVPLCLGMPTGSPLGVRSRPRTGSRRAPRPAHSPVMSTARVATGRRCGRARRDNTIQPVAANTASAASGGSRRWHSQSSAASSASAANSGRPRRRSARSSCSSARAATSSQAPPDGQGQLSMAAGPGRGRDWAEEQGLGLGAGTRGAAGHQPGAGGDTRFLCSPSGRAFKEPRGRGRGRNGGGEGAGLSFTSLPAPLARQVPPPLPPALCPAPAVRSAFEEAGTKSQSCCSTAQLAAGRAQERCDRSSPSTPHALTPALVR